MDERQPVTRKIIHVDMDAFYAAVEVRDRPELQGKPVIVGGRPESRGVVSTCSYEARRYGIHSAMPSSQAIRLCPRAVWIQPNFAKYQAVSRQIREIFHRYTDLVEPLSLDEAFLDVTANKKNLPYATEIARQIKTDIRRITGLTASAGVSFNKFLAKVASDYQKPDGLTVITPKNADEFIRRLPIRKFHGVGKATEKKMLRLSIRNGGDLQEKSREFLVSRFGKVGHYFYDIAHGLDNRPVNPHRIRKSIGMERTFAQDIDDRAVMAKHLEAFARQVAAGLKKEGDRARTVTLKVRYFDFQQITRSVTLSFYCDAASTILHNALTLLEKTRAGEKKVRLLGISVSNLQSRNPGSL